MTGERVPGGVVHKLPEDLRETLVANPAALDAWEGITPLARNEFICWVEDAKQATTRKRRIRRTREELEEGQRRPCCWPGCKHRERTGKPSRTARRAFSLVELMVVVAIVGVLSVLAGYGVSKYLSHVKTVEAMNSLGQLSKDAVGGYEGVRSAFCGSVSNMIPAAATSVSGHKYQSSKAEWQTGNDQNGWMCLRFSLEEPQYYAYTYSAHSTNAQSGGFVAAAYGDLNGDGVFSTFSVTGTAYAGSIAISPNIQSTNPDE